MPIKKKKNVSLEIVDRGVNDKGEGRYSVEAAQGRIYEVETFLATNPETKQIELRWRWSRGRDSGEAWSQDELLVLIAEHDNKLGGDTIPDAANQVPTLPE